MGVENAADILGEMAPDEAADLLLELPEAQAEELLEAMEAPAAAEVKGLLDYPEDTAGGMMTTEYVAVPQTLTAKQVIDRLRSYAWLPRIIYYIYVVESEEQDRLLGVISLRDLLMADTDTAITDLMQRDIATGHVHDAAEDVARVIAHYNLIALPIIDTHGALAGIVTVDDAMDIIGAGSSRGTIRGDTLRHRSVRRINAGGRRAATGHIVLCGWTVMRWLCLDRGKTAWQKRRARKTRGG